MGPSDFFRTLHATFAGILATDAPPEVLIDRVTARAFELFDANIALHTEGLPQPACHRGCPSCCKLRVTATAPEIFLLAHYVGLIHATPAGAAVNLPKRIAQANRATKGQGERQRMALRVPCPFVVRGVCIVHPVRPLACRGHVSFDRAACVRAAAGRDVEVPVSEPHASLRGLIQTAQQSALRAGGFAWGLYELNNALVLALDHKDRRAAWTQGRDSLAPVIGDMDMTAMAATFDAILANR